MEFTVRICVDTQDPALGYDALRASLAFNGNRCFIQDSWLRNNKPVPADVAMKIAHRWQENNGVMNGNLGIMFDTNDPAFRTTMLDLIRKQEIGERSPEQVVMVAGGLDYVRENANDSES